MSNDHHTRKPDEEQPNLDNALFTDIEGPADDAWRDAIWAEMLRRAEAETGQKPEEVVIVNDTPRNAGWMKKLPAHKDELDIHPRLEGCERARKGDEPARHGCLAPEVD